MVTLYTCDFRKISKASVVCPRMVTHSVMSDSCTLWTVATARLLCAWNFPSKNTADRLLRISPTQGSNQCLPVFPCTGRWTIYHCSTWEAQKSTVTTPQSKEYNITCTSLHWKERLNRVRDKAPRHGAWRLRTNDLGNINCHFYLSPWPVMSIPLELPIKNGLD